MMVPALSLALALILQSRPTNEPLPKPRVVLPDESAYQPSPHDGKGTVVVNPTVIPVRSPVTLTLTFTVDRAGIAVGGGVACHVSQFWGWTPPQTDNPESSGYTAVRCSNPEVLLDITCDSANHVVVVRADRKALLSGDTITFVYGDTSFGQNPNAQGMSDHYAEREERFFIKVDGDGDGFFTPIKEQSYFQVVADQPYRLFLRGPSRAHVGQTVDLTLAILDPANNLVETFAGLVELSATEGLALPRSLTLALVDRGTARIPITLQQSGMFHVEAREPEGALVSGRSNPIIATEPQQERYQLYWGDLHIHSNKSDGTSTPEEIYRYARDVARLDVAALTDHDHWGYQPLYEDASTWSRMQEVTDRFHEPGKFVTFLGYEWTNWTYGHRNVIFLNTTDARVYPWHAPTSDEPAELWKLLSSVEALTIPHHPGGGPVPVYWDIHDPRFQPVVEITSVHGVSEHLGHPTTIYSPEKSGMVQSALARGYPLGIIGSGDTHNGHPGMPALGGGTSGLVGIYATSLTRSAIFEAVKARRVYATTGCRAVLRFRMNEVGMGGEARLTRSDTERSLSILVSGDAPIQEVTLVKNNQDTAAWPGNDWVVSTEWIDPTPAKQGDYYYVRIQQTDGQWIWSSPIWITLSGG